jgi:hypothetical protein
MYTHSPTYASADSRNLKTAKNKIITFFKHAPNFSSTGIETQCHEGGGRILLGDNKGGGAVMLRPIRFPVFWRLDVNWTLLYIGVNTQLAVSNSIPTCAKFDLCRTVGNVTTAKPGSVCPSIVQNIDKFQPDCTASHPRIQYSSSPGSKYQI